MGAGVGPFSGAIRDHRYATVFMPANPEPGIKGWAKGWVTGADIYIWYRVQIPVPKPVLELGGPEGEKEGNTEREEEKKPTKGDKPRVESDFLVGVGKKNCTEAGLGGPP
jgi:hypothetical protein